MAETNEYPASHSFRTDFVGRIDNISLAPSSHNALAPVFEAITNAIQAIEDKFGKDNLAKGRIEVEVIRETMDSKPAGFIVRDNGIGFNKTNLDSFLTSDTRYKSVRGGKGIGRFLWLKVFERAFVTSTYESDGASKEISFDFSLWEENQVRNIKTVDTSNETGTWVNLSPFRSHFAAFCPAKETAIRNRILSHFLSYFINMHAPHIHVIDKGDSVDLFDLFSDVVEKDEEYKFEVRENGKLLPFSMHAFLLPKEFSDDEKGNNAVFYGAHGRTVERHELDRAIGIKQIDGEFVYFGFVEGNYLNSVVSQERTNLAWTEEIFEEVHRNAISYTKEFLREPIRKIRVKQGDTIKRVRDEHLRFLSIAKSPETFAESLPLYVQSMEDIFIELSRSSLRKIQQEEEPVHYGKEQKSPRFRR